MYNYFCFVDSDDSIYASTSERFQSNLRPTLNGFGKFDFDSVHLFSVRLVIENFSAISSAFTKSLSTILKPFHFNDTTITEINIKKKKKKVLTRHYNKQ